MLNLILNTTMPKINYKRFALIAAMMVAMLLTGWLILGYSLQTYIISGFISAIWGAGLYIHLDRRDKKRG